MNENKLRELEMLFNKFANVSNANEFEVQTLLQRTLKILQGKEVIEKNSNEGVKD